MPPDHPFEKGCQIEDLLGKKGKTRKNGQKPSKIPSWEQLNRGMGSGEMCSGLSNFFGIKIEILGVTYFFRINLDL